MFTHDPEIIIEEIRHGYVRYKKNDGRRWEVFGVCDYRGDCLIGAYIEGFGTITNKDDIEFAKMILRKERLVSNLDIPVTPEFKNCCPFTYNELERGN